MSSAHFKASKTYVHIITMTSIQNFNLLMNVSKLSKEIKDWNSKNFNFLVLCQVLLKQKLKPIKSGLK